MLTIAKLLDAITNPSKIKMSQNKLAQGIHTSTSTIHAWVKTDTQPTLAPKTIYDGITNCRAYYPSYQNEAEFIDQLIFHLDIHPWEKETLKLQFNSYKQKYPMDGTCTREFMMHMIQLALDKTEIGNTVPFDPFDPTRPIVAIGGEHVLAAMSDGRVFSTGANDFGQCETGAWRDIVSVAAGWRSSMGLRSDGTCIVVGRNTTGNGEIFRWNNLTAICCGSFHFLGLKLDGTVVSYGLGGDGQRNVSDWKHIKAIAAGIRHTVGLCEDGTVLACGSNREAQCEVSSWKHVRQIAAAGDHTVGLTEEGTILHAGDPHTYDFSDWKDIQSVAAGIYHIVGLKKDGTVLLTGSTVGGLDRVYQWWDMKAIYAGFNRTAGIHADGSIWVTNDPYQRTHLNTSAWNLHGERRSESKEPSPFETARKKVISILESVRDTGFKMTPALHASPLDEENIRRLEEIRKLSEESWAYRDRIKTIKPLADIILSYNAAFLDFYKMFTFDQAHENVSVSSDAYDTCIEFLTAVRILLTQVRGI